MEERQIPHYINDPVINRLTAPENKLHRPKIYFVRVGVTIIENIILTIAATCMICSMVKVNEHEIVGNRRLLMLKVFLLIALLMIVITSKYILIWCIKVYQRYAKSETRLKCCFTPSCSEYAILALDKYGVVIGCYKAAGRLLRCHPPGGIDYP